MKDFFGSIVNALNGVVIAIDQNTHTLKRIGDILMAAKDDMTTAITNLNSSVSSEIAAVATAIQNAVTNSGGIGAADAQAFVDQLLQTKQTLDAETASITQVTGTPGNPPPPIPPTASRR